MKHGLHMIMKELWVRFEVAKCTYSCDSAYHVASTYTLTRNPTASYHWQPYSDTCV